jgi:hypothetical protein
MSYFDDASLVMIPSGTKTSKVYSVKPIDGTGDLTFTRSNDTASRVNSAGLIEKVRTNLLPYSEQIDNAVWNKVSTTVTANAVISPDGTQDAETMTVSISDSRVEQTLSLGAGTYTFSVYVKLISETTAGNMRLQGLVDAANVSVNFTPTTEWQRVTATYTAASSLTSVRVRGQSFVGTLAVWGAQLETGDIATDYIATTSAAVSVGPVANVPRLDYLNSSCPKLILEPQRQNVCLWSENFNNAAWVKTNVSVTANSIASPDGYTNADTLAGNGSSGSHIIQQIIAVYGANDTISIFAKKGTNNFIQIYTDFVNTDYANFNLNTGVVGDKGATTGATTITDYGNGWYRCTMVTGSALSGNVNIALISSATSARAETNSLSTNLYIYGAQVESGAYATSYIPTLGSASTRGSDAALKTSISSLIGQDEGTIFVEFEYNYSDSTTQVLFKANQTTDANSVGIEVQGTTIKGLVNSAGGNIATITGTIATGTIKAALAYKTNDMAFYVNGTQVGVDTSGSIAFAGVVDILTIGQFLLNGGTFFPASRPFNQALVFKTRIPNSQLAELTSL